MPTERSVGHGRSPGAERETVPISEHFRATLAAVCHSLTRPFDRPTFRAYSERPPRLPTAHSLPHSSGTATRCAHLRARAVAS